MHPHRWVSRVTLKSDASRKKLPNAGILQVKLSFKIVNRCPVRKLLVVTRTLIDEEVAGAHGRVVNLAEGSGHARAILFYSVFGTFPSVETPDSRRANSDRRTLSDRDDTWCGARVPAAEETPVQRCVTADYTGPPQVHAYGPANSVSYSYKASWTCTHRGPNWHSFCR
jgi:hypothetical protein